MWQGKLAATFADTRLLTAFAIAPLKLQRTFQRDGLCEAMLLHTAGGIVAGDQLDYQIDLEAGARVRLTSASASKIYRSTGLSSHQQITIRQGVGSYLEWCPRETIVFDQATHSQSLNVELAPGAIWVGWDVVRFGRTARGEQFSEGLWRSQTDIWQNETPLWIDRQVLVGGSAALTSLNGLAGYPVMASLCAIGISLPAPTLRPLCPDWGVTQLPHGLLLRHRGYSSEAALQVLQKLVATIRAEAFAQSV